MTQFEFFKIMRENEFWVEKSGRGKQKVRIGTTSMEKLATSIKIV